MSNVEITVRGAHVAYEQPERATVHLHIDLEGPAAKPVFDAVTAGAAAIRSSITPLHSPTGGPVTWWSTDRVQTWANRPWNKDGKQLPLVHHARAAFQVKFSEFGAMSSWLPTAVGHTGVTVAQIEWALTVNRRLELTEKVRRAAVADAVAKAEAYAAALGLGSVQAIAIADAGMLGDGLDPVRTDSVAHTRAFAGAAAPELQFAPSDVSLAANVDARFVAS